MALIDWSEKYSVGVAEIDRQHKKLMDMINGLHDAMKAGKGKDAMSGLIADLKNYARGHFSAEERLMKRYEYPDMAAHEVEHVRFIEQVLDFELAHSEGKAFMTSSVMKFLTDWLTGHITGTDMRYKDFFHAKGVR